MSRYLILLPAPEAEWAELPLRGAREGHAIARAVPARIYARADTPFVAVGPLEPSDQATSMRPGSDGEALVTDGRSPRRPSRSSASTSIESDDEADLRAACERFASRGEHIEFRRLAE